ncbi:hypothetical protein A2U01_0017728, partial [Trifolium medium]|nr:hypothetical protein [Trifolium medium]
MDERFLEATSNCLLCRVESIPFKILGLPVEVNPRRLNTWKSMMESMTKSWEGVTRTSKDSIWCRDVAKVGNSDDLDKNVVVAKRLVGNSHNKVWSWKWRSAVSAAEAE